jgi:hypothetical protein
MRICGAGLKAIVPSESGGTLLGTQSSSPRPISRHYSRQAQSEGSALANIAWLDDVRFLHDYRKCFPVENAALRVLGR